MKRFLGLLFLTGLVQKPDMEQYWSREEATATPYFRKVMSRNRFQIIWINFHFANNETLDKEDKLTKNRPVLDYLLTKFKEQYMPERDISIDEGTLLWRGRLGFKVYNPNKPSRFGIKSYFLACSKTGVLLGHEAIQWRTCCGCAV